MKIKCPACSKVLNIPEAAAGKVVKCPCGKQLRAPGGGGAAPAARPASNQSGPSLSKAAPKPAPRPAPSPGGMGDFDASMLDELTETDLQPVKAVSQPGRVAAPSTSGGSDALQRHASNSDRQAEMLLSGNLAPLPPGLIFVAIINVCGALLPLGGALLLFGLMAALPIMDEMDESDGITFFLIGTGLVVTGLLYLISGICCFVRGKIPWYTLLASFAFGTVISIWSITTVLMEGEADFMLIKDVLSLLIIDLGIWFWLFGEDVRAFFNTFEEPIGKVIGLNAAFVVTAIVLWVVPHFLG